MDDIAKKISELLSDPDGMARIKQMAGALFSSDEAAHSDLAEGLAPDTVKSIASALSPSGSESDSSSSPSDGGLSLPDGFDPIKMLGLISALNSGINDSRTGLLLALKPHLSNERCDRVDKAVRLMKIASLIPVLKEQGLLDIF